MKTIRYSGEDIPVDIVMKRDDGTTINPNNLAGIKVYAVDGAGNVLFKAAYPDTQGYKPIILSDEAIRCWLISSDTATWSNKKIHFEVAIYESQADLDDGLQTTIALSNELFIQNVLIKQEEIES